MTNYTQQDYERDLKILDNAPDGAEYIDTDGDYWIRDKISGACFYDDDGVWEHVPSPMEFMRSLSDIRAMVSMYDQLQACGFDAIKEACDYAQETYSDNIHNDYEGGHQRHGADCFKGRCLRYAAKIKDGE